MNIGGTALTDRPGDYRQDENYTQAPQDNLPFAITQGNITPSATIRNMPRSAWPAGGFPDHLEQPKCR